MKTLLQTYFNQHGTDTDKTFEEIEDHAESVYWDMEPCAEKTRLIEGIKGMAAYRKALDEYQSNVWQMAQDASDESTAWGVPEYVACGYAMDNVEASMDTVKASEEFVNTLAMYIDCGVECEKEIGEVTQDCEVKLPTFKFKS